MQLLSHLRNTIALDKQTLRFSLLALQFAASDAQSVNATTEEQSPETSIWPKVATFALLGGMLVTACIYKALQTPVHDDMERPDLTLPSDSDSDSDSDVEIGVWKYKTFGRG